MFEWMDKFNYEYNSKNHLQEAEEYFDSLTPRQKRSVLVNLLSRYCTERRFGKAAALFEELKRLNYCTSFAFRCMMKLVVITGHPEKVLALAEEMKRRNIPLDSNTYKFYALGCKKLNTIEAVEKLIEATEKDGEDCHWTVYDRVAEMYIRAGEFENAGAALKRLEATNQNKDMFTYGALLRCYCTIKLVNEAATVFEEMKRLNYAGTCAFNNMMNLALVSGEPEKAPRLVEEMKRRNVPLDSFTYGFLVQSYELLNDMEGVEKAIEENEKDGEMCHWSSYSKAATIYIRAGDLEKAETALKKLEESSKHLLGSEVLHYNHLISHYAGTGDLAAVNRVWDSLKTDFQVMTNSSYLAMLSSLLQLDQLDQLHKCYQEWRIGCRRLDLMIISVLIGSYLRQNRTLEAEQVFDEAVMETGSPFFSGRERLIAHFLGKRRIDSALGHLRAAIDVAVQKQDSWCPDTETISAFWKYFEEEKDVDGAEEFVELIKKVKWVDATAYLSLLGTYAAAGRTAPKMRKRMKQDGVEITRDHEVLLEKPHHIKSKCEVNSALRHLRAAIDVLKEDGRWCPDTEKTSTFWKYYAEEKYVDGAEEFG